MTLSRQMLALILLLLLLMLMGSWGVHLINTRSFLQQQLHSHATDTAAALSLSLAPHLQPLDLARVNSTLDAIYDHGFFARITLTDHQGGVISERRAENSRIPVPAWFRDLYPFHPPVAEMALNSGWRLVGKVQVQSSAAPAYTALWQAGWHFIWVALVGLVVALLLGWWLLNKILRPLRAIEQHAQRLARHQFEPLPFMPRTRELRRVVKAINHMADSLSKLFNGLNRKAQRLQQQAYLDPETGLGNRRRFEAELSRRLADEQGGFGVLLVCHLELEQIRHRDGYLATRQLLEGVVNTLRDSVGTLEAALLYRLNDQECAALLPHLDQPQAEQIAEQICSYLDSQEQTQQQTGMLEANAPESVAADSGLGSIGLCFYHAGDSVAQLLSQIDLALAQARRQGANRCHFSLDRETLPRFSIKASQRQQLLENLIAGISQGQAINFSRQAVLRMPSGKPLYYEWNPSFSDEQGAPLPTEMVLALALQRDQLTELEQLISKAILAHRLNQPGSGTDAGISINLSPHSLMSDGLVHWLCSCCRAQPALAERLVIELDEVHLGAMADSLLLPLQRLKQAGVRLAIDHFGRHGTAFSRLSQLRPAFIKVDGQYSRDLQAHMDHRFYLQTLQQLAHGLRTQVIASDVESEVDQMDLLRLGITLMQGGSVSKVEQVTTEG